MDKRSTPFAISPGHDDRKRGKILRRIVFDPKRRLHNKSTTRAGWWRPPLALQALWSCPIPWVLLHWGWPESPICPKGLLWCLNYVWRNTRNLFVWIVLVCECFACSCFSYGAVCILASYFENGISPFCFRFKFVERFKWKILCIAQIHLKCRTQN